MYKKINILIIGLSILLLAACGGSKIGKSPIDDVSDEVYKDLVEWYFFYETERAVLEGKYSSGKEQMEASEWYMDTPQYEEAVEKAKDYKRMLPEFIFPNDLFIKREELTETEDQFLVKMDKLRYLMKIYDWNEEEERYRIVETEEFEEILAGLKKDLEIKDSYNMFESYID